MWNPDLCSDAGDGTLDSVLVSLIVGVASYSLREPQNMFRYSILGSYIRSVVVGKLQ